MQLLESYEFLSQIPDSVLIKRQEEIIKGRRGSWHVYFISDGTAVKIGRTDNVFSRMKSLQCGNPRRLILIGINSYHPNVDVPAKEKQLHSYFNEKRICGEWFLLTEEDIVLSDMVNCVFSKYFSKSFSKTKIVTYKLDDRFQKLVDANNEFQKRKNELNALKECI